MTQTPGAGTLRRRKREVENRKQKGPVPPATMTRQQRRYLQRKKVAK